MRIHVSLNFPRFEINLWDACQARGRQLTGGFRWRSIISPYLHLEDITNLWVETRLDVGVNLQLKGCR